MVILKTDMELLDLIHKMYGHSVWSQHDLAVELGISLGRASGLTLEAGYQRHKLLDSENPVQLQDFIKQPCAKYIIRKKGLLPFGEAASGREIH